MLRLIRLLFVFCLLFSAFSFLPPLLDTAVAQAVRVDVVSAKAVQVVEDVPLVPGKATIVRVDMMAGAQTYATVFASLGQSRRQHDVLLNAGGNTLFVPVDPPGGPGQIPITAQVTVGGLPAGNTVNTTVLVVALQRNGLKVVFIPVDWTRQDQARYWPGHFNTFVSTSSDFFKATYPLPENNLALNAVPQMHMLTPQQRAIVDGRGNLNWNAITSMYSSVAAAGRRHMGDADLVVGILPPRWFARNLNEPNTVGLELHAVRGVVSSQVDADYATLSHEVGHVFNRGDDYNFNRNPPKIGNRIDAPGYWTARKQAIVPGGNPVYYSFMGAQDAGSQYWVDRNTYMAILQMLQSGTALR